MELSMEADLRFSVEVPGARTVSGHLTGSGTALELRVDDSFVFAGRRDAAAIRGLAAGLAHRGVSITVVDRSGPLVTLGARRSPWLQRPLTRSRHIRIERGAGLWSLARGRAQARNAGALPPAELAPPTTMWPLAPTFLRRPHTVRTTHDPNHGGNPRLVMASPPHPRPEDPRPVFRLTRDVTTIGSAPTATSGCPGSPRDTRRCVTMSGTSTFSSDLPQQEPPACTECPSSVRSFAPAPASGSAPGRSFVREEYADHGRPYGGRIGGELGHQKPQPPRVPRRKEAS